MFLSEIPAVSVIGKLDLSGAKKRYVDHYKKEPDGRETMMDWWPLLSLRDRIIVMKLVPSIIRFMGRKDLVELSMRCAEESLSICDDEQLRTLVERMVANWKNPEEEEQEKIRVMADSAYSTGMDIFMNMKDVPSEPMKLAIKMGAAIVIAHAARASLLSPYSPMAVTEALSALHEASSIPELDLSEVKSKLDMVVSLRPEA